LFNSNNYAGSAALALLSSILFHCCIKNCMFLHNHTICYWPYSQKYEKRNVLTKDNVNMWTWCMLLITEVCSEPSLYLWVVCRC